MHNNQSYSSW